MHAPQHLPKQNHTKPEVNKKVWAPPTDADFIVRWWGSGLVCLFWCWKLNPGLCACAIPVLH